MLAKSVNPSRIDDNRRIVPLEVADLEALEDIHKRRGLTRFVYPEFGVSYVTLVWNVIDTDRSEGEFGLPGQAVITGYRNNLHQDHFVQLLQTNYRASGIIDWSTWSSEHLQIGDCIIEARRTDGMSCIIHRNGIHLPFGLQDPGGSQV